MVRVNLRLKFVYKPDNLLLADEVRRCVSLNIVTDFLEGTTRWAGFAYAHNSGC